MPSTAYLQALYRKCPRIVVADEAPEDVPAIVPDNFGGGRLAGGYAWDMGYRSFAFISRNPDSPNLEARLAGFRAAVEARAGRALDIPVFRGDPWSEGGQKTLQKLRLSRAVMPVFGFAPMIFLLFTQFRYSAPCRPRRTTLQQLAFWTLSHLILDTHSARLI